MRCLRPSPAVTAPRKHQRRLLRCSASAPDAADAAFQALCRSAGVASPFGAPALSLRNGAFGRGLFAARDLAPGEPLLSVPLSLCLVAERAAAVAVPGAPWATLTAGAVPCWPILQTPGSEYPLPWDLRLSLALLDAAAGDGGTGSEAATWHEYGALLPPPSSLAHPITLPPQALRLACQPALEADWTADAARLTALCPAIPAPDLLHSVALARSRAFVAGDVFLVVPFVDMANTSFAPGGVNAAAALRVAPGRDAAAALLAADGTFELAAGSAGIKAGQEVLISYGAGGTPNASLLARYGFVRDANPNDRLLIVPQVAGLDAAALERAAAAATEARGGRWLRERSTDAVLQAALASIPCRPAPARAASATARPPAEERADVAALRSAVADAVAALPPGGSESDAAELAALRDQGDPAAALLQLRAEHRGLLTRVAWLLDAYDAALAK